MSVLEVRDLSIRFGGLQALQGLTLDVNEFEIVGLIGPNGAGKTTMFNVVSRIYQPTEGRVLFRGENLLKVPAYGIARHGKGRDGWRATDDHARRGTVDGRGKTGGKDFLFPASYNHTGNNHHNVSRNLRHHLRHCCRHRSNHSILHHPFP